MTHLRCCQWYQTSRCYTSLITHFARTIKTRFPGAQLIDKHGKACKNCLVAVLITCKDVCFDYPAKRVFEGITLGVNTGERIGIVGSNGDGKSTLLSLLSGAIEPDAGQVLRSGSFTVGIIGQRDSFDESDTPSQVLDAANATVGAYRWEADRKARDVVDALLGDVDLNAPVSALSGGQRRRVDLARLLVGSWDVLMLDEPTNHLDVRAIDWLASHLNNRWQPGQGALLVVTHDRWFLDEVCQRMWEVHDGSVLPFEGGYSAYVMQRVERDRLEQLAKRKRANQLRKELAWLSRGAQARRSKPKFHLEAARALIADVPPMRNPLELQRVAMARLGKQVYEIQDVCIDRGEGASRKHVLSDITWTIGPGERIGILGENGAGKSTLLGLLDGSIRPTLGHIKVGRTVQAASLSQNLIELAPVEDDVVRVVCSRYKTTYQVDGRNLSPTKLLERMGFSHDALNMRVKDLSGGQRRRLQLLLTLLDEPNVLILDEPGNDLDTDMLAATEDLLDSWPGNLVVVSHDRYLLERVTDNLYGIVDGRVRHMPGGVDEYLALVKNSRASAAPSRDDQASSEASQENGCASASSTQDDAASTLSNAERHRLRKEVASLERRMETAQQKLDAAKDALAACDPYDFEALGAAQAGIEQARLALEEIEDLWLVASDRLQ